MQNFYFYAFYFLFFYFVVLGAGLSSAHMGWAGPGPASLAWSLAQASDQPGHCACMRELLTHALHNDKVIICQVGKNKRSLPGATRGGAGAWGRRRWRS
jgi:hypothetical protein